MTKFTSADVTNELRRPAFSVPILVAVAGASGSSGGGTDLRIQRWTQGSTTGRRRDVAQWFTQLGDRDTGALLVYSTLLKRITRRTRPSFNGTGARMVVQRNGEGQDDRSSVSRFEPLFEPRNGGFGVAYRYSW